jgi:hypothetical protein
MVTLLSQEYFRDLSFADKRGRDIYCGDAGFRQNKSICGMVKGKGTHSVGSSS